MKKEIKKIAIVGLGGVGGYIGGTLARDNDEVFFLARGKRLESIKNNGIHIKSTVQGEFISHPKNISNKASDLGVMDLIIIAVKSYSLASICKSISSMIDEDTIILPIMNGINISDKIKKNLKIGQILDGLIYIMSESCDDFSIDQKTPFSKIVFSSLDDAFPKELLEKIKQIFLKSNIKAIIPDDIIAETWRKFIFNCAYNTVTAAHNALNVDLCKDLAMINDFKMLLNEAYAISQALNVNLSSDIVETHYNLVMTLPETGTSSLKGDIEAGRKSEIDIFSGEIIKLAEKYNIEIPITRKYDKLIRDIIYYK